MLYYYLSSVYRFSVNEGLCMFYIVKCVPSSFKCSKMCLTAGFGPDLGWGVNVWPPIVKSGICHDFISLFTLLDLTSAFCLLCLLHICAGLLIRMEVVWCYIPVVYVCCFAPSYNFSPFTYMGGVLLHYRSLVT